MRLCLNKDFFKLPKNDFKSFCLRRSRMRSIILIGYIACHFIQIQYLIDDPEIEVLIKKIEIQNNILEEYNRKVGNYERIKDIF
jgi:hypothetical protein